MEAFNDINSEKWEKWFGFFFYLFLGLILYNRLLLFTNINTDFIDSDQPFMWAGAIDYSKGIFMEPRFYGQNYNTFMEPLFAVPLIWCGLPVYHALPIATHFIFLFPFLFTTVYLFVKRHKVHSLMVLAILLCLPSSYDILTSLPRGFVTNVFFGSFFVLSFLNPQHVRFMALNLFMVVLGYFVSANSLLLSVPFAGYLFLNNYKNKTFYLIGFVALLLFVPFYFLFDDFYKQHPSYVIYSFHHDFSMTYLKENLFHPNRAFAHVGFFMEQNAIFLLLAFLFLGYFLFTKNRNGFYSFLLFIGVLIVTLLSEKSVDGTFWPWYSYSRLYVSIPLLMGLLLILVSIKNKYFILFVFVVSSVFGSYKLFRFKQNVALHTQESLWNGVHLVPLKSAINAMDFYKEACRKNNAGFFLISNGFWLNTFLDYGGPAVYKDFPETEESNSERRYWVREGNKNRVITDFVFLSSSYNFDKLVQEQTDFSIVRLDDYGLMHIKNNRLTLGEFIKLSRALEAKGE